MLRVDANFGQLTVGLARDHLLYANFSEVSTPAMFLFIKELFNLAIKQYIYFLAFRAALRVTVRILPG